METEQMAEQARGYRYGGGGSPTRGPALPPTECQVVYVGLANANAALTFFEDEQKAVSWLMADPAAHDSSAMAPTRHVWQAQLTNVTQMEVMPPQPARLIRKP